ncbi:MAG: transglutaminase-like domain-containing protein [Armatimonadota bacterium]
MKSTFYFAMVCIILAMLLAVPASAQQDEGLQTTMIDVTKNWQFDQQSLDILKAAIKQKHNMDVSAVHLIDDSVVCNIIIRIWHFVWNKQHLKITESSIFGAVGREDAQVTRSSLSYSVSTDTGMLICEWSRANNSGKTIVALVKPFGKGIVVERFDPEHRRIKKTFMKLEAPYREPFHGALAPALTAGQRDVTVSYDSETNSLHKNEWVVASTHRKQTGNPPWIVQLDMTVGGNKTTAFLDQKNHIVKSSTSGTEFVQCDPAVAIQERTGPRNQISLITPIDCWVLNGSRLTSVSLRVEAKNPSGLFTSQNARQSSSLVPGKANQVRLRVRSERAPTLRELANVKLPATADIREALAPAADIESDSPEIVKCARSIVATEKCHWQQALLLAKWVSKHIKATYDIANGTALETLHSKRGDCSEDANLFVGLARSLHIPARYVGGWKLMIDSVCGHAWAEIYVGGRWVELDPTTAAMADATYIKKKQSSLATLKCAQIDEFQYGRNITTVDKNRSYWTLRSHVYYNRALGLAMTIPIDAHFAVPFAGLPFPLPLTEGETPVGNVPQVLFTLSMNSEADGKPNPQESESLAVSIAERSDENEVANIASGGVFFGAKIGGHTVIQFGDRKISVIKFNVKDGISGIAYEVPLNASTSITFVSTNVDSSKELSHDLPPVVASIISTIKLTTPDIGTTRTVYAQ